jgi:hypothetical protein
MRYQKTKTYYCKLIYQNMFSCFSFQLVFLFFISLQDVPIQYNGIYDHLTNPHYFVTHVSRHLENDKLYLKYKRIEKHSHKRTQHYYSHWTRHEGNRQCTFERRADTFNENSQRICFSHCKELDHYFLLKQQNEAFARSSSGENPWSDKREVGVAQSWDW